VIELNTDFYLTISGLAICAGIGLLSWKQHTRENNTLKPRMMVNLFGFETGGRF